MHYYPLFIGILSVLLFETASCAVLEQFFNGASTCELHCEKTFSGPTTELRRSCAEGCRLFTVIGLAKGLSDRNKTLGLCLSACSEAFNNESTVSACNYGCRRDSHSKLKDDSQTLHLLTPLIYVKSAYNTMAHHVKQFISTSWTVYVQEDSGKMVILQTNPKMVESSDYTFPRDNGNSMKNYQQNWQEEKLDWMDCISHQSGIPRWLLVIVLFGFILALLWLCCATAVTAPNHYVSSSKKKNVGYVLLCEPNNGMKPSPPLINCDEEAPPLPPKVTLI